MSESCRENLPLLCDDHSDEEFRIRKSSPKFQSLFRYSASGRARTQAIGAAAIITRWPEHFSSFLTYWWIGLGMIAFMIFVMYNSIVAISMLPPTHHRPLNVKKTQYISDHGTSHDTDIFMHIFVTNDEEINTNSYLPYIHTFTQKYSSFKHNIIFIIRDESNDILNNLSDGQINEMALNSLWTPMKKINKIKLGKSADIKIVSLTKYMDESPLKKYWRRLPQQFFGFLIRCIAIWEKGGIAFDPLILTPNSPNSGYIENLEHVISKLSSKDINKSTKRDRKKISKKKVNNIRDIIENLKNQDDNHSMQENLSVAENKIVLSKTNNLNIYDNKIKRSTKDVHLETYKKNDMDNIHTNKSRNFYLTEYTKNDSKNSVELSKDQEFNNLPSINRIENKHQLNDELSTKRNLLPMFLEYLYKHPDNVTENIKEPKSTIKNVTLSNQIINLNTKNVTIIDQNHANNSIITNLFKKKGSYVKSDTEIIPSEKDDNFSLSIDLKGNLVATKTSCHAFIGTIFSNAVHHSDDESIADFIITELSIFCKGVLSSCKGIDVILL